MRNDPTRDTRIQEAMEACRPDSDDLDHPAMAFLAEQLATDPTLRDAYARLKRVDAVFADAFRDVPVPDGLTGRILDRLVVTPNGRTAEVDDSPVEKTPPAEPIASQPTVRKRPSRRSWLVLAGGLTVAVSLLIAGLIGVQDRETLTETQVWVGAIEFFDRDADEIGQLTDQVRPPDSHPFGSELASFPNVRWRRIDDFLGHGGVAYDMVGNGGTQATLYVVRCKVPGLPNTPSASPFQTGQRSTSAWQSGDLLYVLVVNGGPRAYRGFLPRPGPWA